MKIDLGPWLKWYGRHRGEVIVVAAFLVLTLLLGWAMVVANEQECVEFQALAETRRDSLDALIACKGIQADRNRQMNQTPIPTGR